ncbi:hypothetical protein [Bradyrhizobium neotropicale]|uniref:Uncharacterized protein n=1 Tax=Bradyrhizobium neotropicale TaxID=1497615 RepID=A0A176YYG4_9BRAD|nr:hypothetical protein [Bradyrhizobium neotropicale]OAF12831.1 hypothetical protein AXW67_19695 [Bradyrhizobium neotropicale]
MTSISALSHHHHASPLKRLQDELQAEVSSGAINSSDQSALASALSDIDSSLQSSSATDQSSGSKSSPEAFKSKIDDLIQQEVSAGKLTDQQATELQGIFKAALSHGPDGAGGPGEAGGPPPAGGPAPANGTARSSSGSSVVDLLQQFLDSLKGQLTDSTSSSTTGSSDMSHANGSSAANGTDSPSSSNSATDLLEQFLQSLKNSLADSTYSATRPGDPAKASDPSLSGVLIDDRI